MHRRYDEPGARPALYRTQPVISSYLVRKCRSSGLVLVSVSQKRPRRGISCVSRSCGRAPTGWTKVRQASLHSCQPWDVSGSRSVRAHRSCRDALAQIDKACSPPLMLLPLITARYSHVQLQAYGCRCCGAGSVRQTPQGRGRGARRMLHGALRSSIAVDSPAA